jgi:hypothetical protein
MLCALADGGDGLPKSIEAAKVEIKRVAESSILEMRSLVFR